MDITNFCLLTVCSATFRKMKVLTLLHNYIQIWRGLVFLLHHPNSCETKLVHSSNTWIPITALNVNVCNGINKVVAFHYSKVGCILTNKTIRIKSVGNLTFHFISHFATISGINLQSILCVQSILALRFEMKKCVQKKELTKYKVNSRFGTKHRTDLLWYKFQIPLKLVCYGTAEGMEDMKKKIASKLFL